MVMLLMASIPLVVKEMGASRLFSPLSPKGSIVRLFLVSGCHCVMVKDFFPVIQPSGNDNTNYSKDLGEHLIITLPLQT